MPQVPVYGDRQLRTQALQPVMQQTPDVSSGARALAQGLGQVAEAADRIDLRDSQDAAFKAQDQIRKEWANVDADLRKQYRGDLAGQYKTNADKWWADAKNKYTAELNPRAQALAGRQIGEFKSAVEVNGIQYVEREKANARKVNFETLQDTRMRDAATRATPETAAALAAATSEEIRRDSLAYAAAEGFTDPAVGERIANERLDKFHAAMALTLASRPDGKERAAEYLNKFGENMPLEMRDRVSDQIEVTAERAKTKAAKDIYGNLRFSIANGIYPTKAQYEELRQVDPMAAAQAKEVENAHRKAAKVEAGGGSVKTDTRAYFELRDRVLAQAKGGPAVDVLAYMDRVARGDLEEVKKMQENIGKPGKVDRMFTDERTIDSYRPDGMKTTEPEWLALRKRLEERLVVAREQKGGDITDKEARGVLDEEFMVGKVPGRLWGTNEKPRWEMTPEELKQAQFPGAAAPARASVGGSAAPTRSVGTIYQISGNDRKLITDALRAEGVPLSEDAIQARYKLAKGLK
jgi:hypothetical protein